MDQRIYRGYSVCSVSVRVLGFKFSDRQLRGEYISLELKLNISDQLLEMVGLKGVSYNFIPSYYMGSLLVS